MSNIEAKAAFLRKDYINKLSQIPADTKGLWGKMNPQQMIEHMSYALRQANGKDLYTIVTPEENIARMQTFMMSEKPFRENTPNQLLPDEPEPAKHARIEESLSELKEEINHFFSVFEQEPDKMITNPFFGHMTYEMWVQLLHKHAWHHLKQFGVNE